MAGVTRQPVTDDAAMRRSYVSVVISWVIVLALLFAFQEYFT
jgi:hypothetical protein